MLVVLVLFLLVLVLVVMLLVLVLVLVVVVVLLVSLVLVLVLVFGAGIDVTVNLRRYRRVGYLRLKPKTKAPSEQLHRATGNKTHHCLFKELYLISTHTYRNGVSVVDNGVTSMPPNGFCIFLPSPLCVCFVCFLLSLPCFRTVSVRSCFRV